MFVTNRNIRQINIMKTCITKMIFQFLYTKKYKIYLNNLCFDIVIKLRSTFENNHLLSKTAFAFEPFLNES